MNDKDYELLICLSEEMNLTRAAERLYITQPALTYRLQQLEQEFNTAIVNKTGRQMKLTPEGEYLVAYSRKMLTQLRLAKDHIVNMRSSVTGLLRLGVFSYFGLHMLPRILKDFKSQYPYVQFNVDTGFSEEIFSLLLDEEIHIAILRGDFPWRGCKHLLSSDNFCIISPVELELSQLPKMPRIDYKLTVASSKQKKYGVSYNKIVSQWWYEKFQEDPNVIMQLDSYESCKEMVRHGLGYSIIPDSYVHKHDKLFIVPLVLDNGELIRRNTWIYYRESSLEYPIVASFAKMLTQDPDLYCCL